MTKSIQVGVRLELELLERIDRLAEASARIPGLKPTRADVMRAAMLRGLDALEAELGKHKR